MSKNKEPSFQAFHIYLYCYISHFSPTLVRLNFLPKIGSVPAFTAESKTPLLCFGVCRYRKDSVISALGQVFFPNYPCAHCCCSNCPRRESDDNYSGGQLIPSHRKIIYKAKGEDGSLMWRIILQRLLQGCRFLLIDESSCCQMMENVGQSVGKISLHSFLWIG